ncbi:MAG: hypothetical protein AB7E21_12050 [Pseudodonghicola sp.]|uniref:hypothetical protein n=1 Tax=Pseudodonghicola sp. TaxID=1969463 RepID=UPI003A983969
MTHQEIEFHQRVERLSRRHAALVHGADTYLRADGLLVAAPRRRWSGRAGLSMKALALCVLAFILFKGFLIVAVGAVTYDSRVERLAQGTPAEAIGAWAMQREPVSDWLAQEMRRWRF